MKYKVGDYFTDPDNMYTFQIVEIKEHKGMLLRFGDGTQGWHDYISKDDRPMSKLEVMLLKLSKKETGA